MMMKSPSRNTRLLPTGGFSCARFASIHCLKLKACRDCMCPPSLRMLRVAVEREDAMRSRPVTHAVVRAAAVTLALSAAGCSHLHWPWQHSPPPPPVPVHELDVSGAAADAFPQYRKRNTLLLDLSAASGSGS